MLESAGLVEVNGVRVMCSGSERGAQAATMPQLSAAPSLSNLYTEAHLQWMRVVDWAKGLSLVPLEEILATAAKRSAEHVPPKHAEV